MPVQLTPANVSFCNRQLKTRPEGECQNLAGSVDTKGDTILKSVCTLFYPEIKCY